MTRRGNTSSGVIHKAEAAIGACSKETVKAEEKGKKSGAPASVKPGTDTDTGHPHALPYCSPPLVPAAESQRVREERGKRGPLASGPVTVCHHAIRRLAAGAQYAAYTPRSTTPATPPKKRHEQMDEPNPCADPRPPPFHSQVVTQEGGGVQVGAVEEGGASGGYVSLRSSRRKAKG